MREDWVGWTALALLLIAALAALMLCLRELIGFSRLARLNRIRADVARAIADRDPKRERKAALRLAALYARRPEQAWSVRRFREHARDVHDAGELLALADREMVAPLDRPRPPHHHPLGQARRHRHRALARWCSSPSPTWLIENLRLLRGLASLYGGRPGFFGVLRLAQLVLAHIVATGGVALTDDLLGQFLGQDILRRLSRRLGEGAFNGALTARIGIAAIEVIRPLPFLAAKRPARARRPGRGAQADVFAKPRRSAGGVRPLAKSLADHSANATEPRGLTPSLAEPTHVRHLLP